MQSGGYIEIGEMSAVMNNGSVTLYQGAQVLIGANSRVDFFKRCQLIAKQGAGIFALDGRGGVDRAQVSASTP